VPALVDAVEALQVLPQDQEDVLLLLQVRSAVKIKHGLGAHTHVTLEFVSVATFK
jgi:hypothetical protein